MRMIEDFKKFIQEQELLVPNSKTLLAVSGGIDSVAMVDLFQKAGMPFSIAHCNFQLRGTESDGDQKFVEQLAKDFKVDFCTKRFDTLAYSEANRISIQLAARQLRYEWFLTLLKENEQIAVAHHQNDAIETMIYNLTKGTGLAGLRGIKPKNGNIIRPLLFAQRNDIEAYAEQNQLKWREDSSNSSTKYARNLIRHEVIPILKQINPSIEKTSKTTFERLQLIENFILASVKEKLGVLYFDNDLGIEIDTVELKNCLNPLVFLGELIFPFGFTFLDAKQILASLEQSESKRFLTLNFELIKDRSHIFIRKLENSIPETPIFQIEVGQQLFQHAEFQLNIREMPFSGTFEKNNPNRIFMDKSKLKFPLTLRKWANGDIFTPFGMKGNKKISDFLIDEKVLFTQKEKIWVLCSGLEIVWVVGYRISDKVKITDQTKELISFELN